MSADPSPVTLLGHLTDRRGAHEAFAIDMDGVPLPDALASQYVSFDRSATFPVDATTEATYVTDASMTATSNVLSSTSYTFTTADVGKTVGVRGAGVVSADYASVANDGVLVSTIASISSGDAVLADNATTTCVDVPAVFGFPIDEELQAARNLLEARGGGTLSIPAGTWITTEPLVFADSIDVQVVGAGQALTTVYHVYLGAASPGTVSAWLYAESRRRFAVSDFTADGSFFAATDAYASPMKLLFVAQTEESSVRRMSIINCPATAVTFDFSTECVISDNTIVNAGRLAQAAASLSGMSGSAIGIALPASSDATMLITNNFITGGYDNAVPSGRTGIHLEGAITSAEVTSPGIYIVSENVISNHAIGIRDSGGRGIQIINNQIRACQWGISVGSGGSTSTTRAGQDTVVSGNMIRDLINSFGTGETIGVLVSTAATSDATGAESGRTIIDDNVIVSPGGYGIRITGSTTSGIPLDLVIIRNNVIRDPDSNAIRITGYVNDLCIDGNSISGVTTAIFADGATTWTVGRIIDNYFASVTTGVSISGSATTTRVEIRNNSDTAEQISIPAVLWTAGEGTPAITQIGTSAKAKGWAHDADTDESITYPIIFPSHWSTYHMDLWWKNAAGGTGDVRWVASQAVTTDGGDIDPAPGDGESIVAAAPVGDVVDVTRVQTSAPITAGALHTLVLNRDANNVADTLANDCISVLLVLTRAS